MGGPFDVDTPAGTVCRMDHKFLLARVSKYLSSDAFDVTVTLLSEDENGMCTYHVVTKGRASRYPEGMGFDLSPPPRPKFTEAEVAKLEAVSEDVEFDAYAQRDLTAR